MRFGILSVLMSSVGVAGPGGGGGAPTPSGGDGGGSIAVIPAGGGEITPSGDDGGGGGDLAPSGDDSVAQGGTFRALERGKPTKQTREALGALVQSNPEYKSLVRAIPRAFAVRDSFFQKVARFGTNPFKALDNLISFWDKSGGPRRVQELQETELDQIASDKLYADSDPQLIEQMTQTPAAKAAFVKLMPHSMKKFEELSPNAFSATMARAMLGHMKSTEMTADGDTFDIPLSVRRMSQAVAALPKDAGEKVPGVAVLIEEAKIIGAYIALLQNYTKLQPEDLAPAIPATDRERSLAERELNTMRGEWKADIKARVQPVYNAEWVRQSKDRGISARQAETIWAIFRRKMAIAQGTVQDYQKQVDQQERSRDRQGYLATHFEFFKANVKEKLEQSIEDVMGPAGPRRRATNAPTVTAQPGTRPAVAPPARLTPGARVNEVPGPNDIIHNGAQSQVMRHNREGILSDTGAARYGMKRGDKIRW